MFPELFPHVKPRTFGALSYLIGPYLACCIGRRPDLAVASACPGALVHAPAMRMQKQNTM